MLNCPFCWEDDFDAVGLKWHLLQGHCKEFNQTGDPPRTVRGTTLLPHDLDKPE